MSDKVTCDYCGEACEDSLVRRGEKTYCCEACAFEAARSVDCSGRSDSGVSESITEGPKSTD